MIGSFLSRGPARSDSAPQQPLFGAPLARVGQWAAQHPRALHASGVVAVAIVVAYFVVRIFYTSEGAHPIAYWTLLGAEIFSLITLLLFLYDAWDVPPRFTPTPVGISTDIVIATYNEDVSIIEPTIVSSLRVTGVGAVWVLDDGGRESVRDLCALLGARYIARETHEHAKAGNINHALPQFTSDVLLFLDADHVPSRSIITTMSGYFSDPQVAVVQSPHSFRNRDSSQHRGVTRHEQSLFYEVLMPAREKSQTAFWSGSAAILRRSALLDIGGVAVETLAEDLHTTLRLQRSGYTVRYHNEPLVSALAPHTTLDYLLQRDRWARGTLGVMFSPESPVFGRGWTLGQRLHYLNNLLYYVIPVQRLAYVAVLVMVFLFGWLPLGNISLPIVGLLLASLAATAVASVLFSRGKRDAFDGSQFNWLSSSIHLKALLDAILGRKTKFMVTPKVATQLSLSEKVSALRLPLVVTTVLVGSWLYALADFAGLTRIVPGLSSIFPAIDNPLAFWWASFFMLLEVASLERLLRREFRRRQVRMLWRFQTRMPALVGGKAVVITDIHESGMSFESDPALCEVGVETEMSLSPARRMLRESKSYRTTIQGFFTPVRILELPGKVVTAGTLRWATDLDRWEAQDLCYAHLAMMELGPPRAIVGVAERNTISESAHSRRTAMFKKSAGWISGVLAPLIFVAIVLQADTLEGPKTAYVGVLAVAPMLSAVFGTPLMTWIVAVVTLVSGYVYGSLASDGNVPAQNVRLIIIGLVGIIAIIASITRWRMQQSLIEARVASARNEAVEVQANTDSMTGLLNRRGLGKAIRELEPGFRSVAVLDCDQLKLVNDTYGHMVGDEYIKAIASRLNNSVSSRDSIARWGGDEFLVLISAPPQEAESVVKRLLAKVSDAPISTTAGPIAGTVTAGVAAWPEREKLDDTLRRADEALYAAKALGRGRLSVAAS